MSDIDVYALIGRVGTGTTSTVWKAHDVELDRDVALKRLENPSPERRRLWQAEARLLATLSDPHIVDVYGYIENDESAFIVEQWVEGATLSAVLTQHGKLSTDQALGVIRGALLGLAHAHERGVVHRDVSPNNVLVDLAGTSRLIDFGLAGPSGSVGNVGTSAYRSPETTSGQPVTPASDVYSVAAVLTHLLTGTAADPPAPGAIDPGLRGVVRRALETDPASRYPNAGAFLAALEEAAQRRYGAAWWTEAGMAGLATSSGAALITTVVGGGGAAPAIANVAAPIATAAGTTDLSEHPAPVAANAATAHRRRPSLRTGLIALVAVLVAAIAVAAAVWTASGGGSEQQSSAVVTSTTTSRPRPTTTPAPFAPSATQLSTVRLAGTYDLVRTVVKSDNLTAPVGRKEKEVYKLTTTCATRSPCTFAISGKKSSDKFALPFNGRSYVIDRRTTGDCYDGATGKLAVKGGSVNIFHQELHATEVQVRNGVLVATKLTGTALLTAEARAGGGCTEVRPIDYSAVATLRD